jgi:glutamate carboxypeptidase
VILDVRGWHQAEIDRVVDELRRYSSRVTGTAITVTAHPHRPPMPRLATATPLVDRARTTASAIGLTLAEQGVGGGSEANLVAPLGVPVIDGLGPVGGGAHALDEHVSRRSLIDRAALLAGLIADDQGHG